jgi:hypothetical protein
MFDGSGATRGWMVWMRRLRATMALVVALGAVSLGVTSASEGAPNPNAPASPDPAKPKVTEAIAFAKTPPLSEMPPFSRRGRIWTDPGERGSGPPQDRGHQADGALQTAVAEASMADPLFTFEGPSNADNLNIFGFRVAPPDPVGDVGINHYVAMVNLNFAVYSKQGDLLLGPLDTGTLWQDFPIEDCTDPSGDPIVIYDEIANRWVLSQFTTRFATNQFYNCVAVSETQDPTGSYFLYAFSTGENFPDYPKYGLWPDAYYITTREFAPDNSESIGIYAVDRRQMLTGNPAPRMVSFQLTEPAYLVGDGLLPADLDGKRMPPAQSPEYFVGSMDDGAFDGAPFDGLNIFEMKVKWSKPEESTFTLTKQVEIADFDTIFPCAPTSRQCIPQPDTPVKVDILSYRQRPTWRLAYRNFGTHESLVTNQSVEARPGIAGSRWWELRNPSDAFVYQEGTWAPDDGVHRWMGSIAMDKQGNAALGYSVSNATDVYPGIRYAGRFASDSLGDLAQGEATLIDGSGSQLTTSGRWGDYTSMNVDPKDGCTFYYINQYYEITELAAWQTRIGAFRFPGCQ